MRILFHAPGVVTFRPEMRLPHSIGVQPTNVTKLGDLLPTHRLTGNRGNLIHAEAPARTFAKEPRRSAYANIASLRKSLGARYSAVMADNFDAVVVSMANFIRPNHDGTQLYLAIKGLRERVKVIIVGAGLQGSHKLSAMMPGNRELLAIMNDQAVFGVRGEKTAEWLVENGFGNCTVLGCPSLFAFPDSILSLDYAAAAAQASDADVMTAGHLTFHRNRMDPRGKELSKAFEGIRASYVMQDEFFGYDGLLDRPGLYREGRCEIDAATINDHLRRRTRLKFDFQRYYYFSDSGSWRQAALRHDVFIGDRFHGGVAALQASVPAIFLSHDNRVAELTGYFGLPALSSDEFASKGLRHTMEELLSPENEARMKALYRQRHGHYAQVLGAQGITVTPLPAA